MKSIQIPIESVQTKYAKQNWNNFQSNQCCLCGKKVGKNPKYIHLLTNGNIISQGVGDIKKSQGLFPVGRECVKKLTIKFAY